MREERNEGGNGCARLHSRAKGERAKSAADVTGSTFGRGDMISEEET